MHIVASGAAALLLVLTCSAVPASAMPGAGNGSARITDPAERFSQMDTDHDGNMTWEELSAARPNLNRNAFDTIDANHDGHIDLNEWKAFSAGHGGSVSMPGMNEMMKAMKGAGNSAAPSGPGASMPLIMPPAQKNSSDMVSPAPSNDVRHSGAMPLIVPPQEEK